MKEVVYLSRLRRDLKRSFAQTNIDVNDVDCILMEVLNLDFTQLAKDRLISCEEERQIMSCVKERKQGKPVTKIFNKAYFYGYQFFVDNNVLSPRSETELLVDYALQFVRQHPQARVIDLCTGSGAIACAICKKSADFGDLQLFASDISPKALAVAKQNAKNLDCDITFVQSDMFDNLQGNFDLVVSNPPYIETATIQSLDKEVKDYDPTIALDGGVDGLDFYRKIKNNLNRLNFGGMCIMEIGYNQGESVKQIFKEYSPQIVKDYCNNDRILIVRK